MKLAGNFNVNSNKRKVERSSSESFLDRDIIDRMYEDGYRCAGFGEYMRRSHNYNVFKVPMNAGFSCPNIDGRLNKKGCTYCPDRAKQFTYESFRRVIKEDLEYQVADQVDYYKKKGAGDKALVYVAFGTNTYMQLNDLKRIFDAALKHEDVVGLSVGTRPDCIPCEVLDLFADYVDMGYEMWLELGQQSVHYHTVENVNRQHGVAELIRATNESHKRGIYVCVFNIMGLPYETPSEMIETARILSTLGIDAVKLYPLLVMYDTQILSDYKSGKYRPISDREYVMLLADFVENLSPYVLIQRFSKDCGLDGKAAPLWDTHRWIVGPRVDKLLALRKSRQGAKYKVTLGVDELVPLE